MNFSHWPTDLYTAQPYDVELSVRIEFKVRTVFKSERPIIPGNRKDKQKLQMKQNPINSIKAGYRVELRAENHIKITSDNLMFHGKIRFYRIKLAMSHPKGHPKSCPGDRYQLICQSRNLLLSGFQYVGIVTCSDWKIRMA